MAGPAEVTNGFARRARELGARIVEGVDVTAIDVERGRARGVRTSQGAIAAPIVINAAGPAAARRRPPGRRGRRRCIRGGATSSSPSRSPTSPGRCRSPPTAPAASTSARRWSSCCSRPGDVEDIGEDFTVPVDRARIDETVEKALHRIPIVEKARIAGGWAGPAPADAGRPRDHRLGARRRRASSSPSASAATASSTRRPPAATSASGCSTASRRSTCRCSIPVASPPAARSPPRSRPRRRVSAVPPAPDHRRRPPDPRRHPGRRPHHMSFTTLDGGELRLRAHRDAGRPGRLGRGRVPGRPHLERGVGGVDRRHAGALRDPLAAWAATRRRSRRCASRWPGGCRATRSRARPSRWRCGTSTGARSACPVHRLLGGRVRDRVPLSWSLAVSGGEAEVAEAREKVARGHRIFKIKTAAHPVAEDVARVRAIREAVGPDVRAARGRQPGLGPADRAPGHPRHGALRPRLRRAAGAALGPRRPGRDRAQRERADHGRRVVRLAAGRAGHRPARRRVDPGPQAHQVGGPGQHDGHRAHRRGRRTRLLRRLHDRDLAGHRRLPARRRWPPLPSPGAASCSARSCCAGDVVREPVRYADGCILALDGPGLGVEVDESRSRSGPDADLPKEDTMRRFTVVALALVLIAAALPGEAQQRNLTWTAGQVGGGWYSQAGGFVELIKSKDASFNIKVIPGAGIQNMTKLQQGETEIAWGLPPFIVASYARARIRTRTSTRDMRLVMNGLGFVHIQFCVPADYPAKSIREIFESQEGDHHRHHAARRLRRVGDAQGVRVLQDDLRRRARPRRQGGAGLLHRPRQPVPRPQHGHPVRQPGGPGRRHPGGLARPQDADPADGRRPHQVHGGPRPVARRDPQGHLQGRREQRRGHPDHRHGQHHRRQRQGAARRRPRLRQGAASATSTACARCTRRSRTSIPRTRSSSAASRCTPAPSAPTGRPGC